MELAFVAGLKDQTEPLLAFPNTPSTRTLSGRPDHSPSTRLPQRAAVPAASDQRRVRRPRPRSTPRKLVQLAHAASATDSAGDSLPTTEPPLRNSGKRRDPVTPNYVALAISLVAVPPPVQRNYRYPTLLPCAPPRRLTRKPPPSAPAVARCSRATNPGKTRPFPAFPGHGRGAIAARTRAGAALRAAPALDFSDKTP